MVFKTLKCKKKKKKKFFVTSSLWYSILLFLVLVVTTHWLDVPCLTAELRLCEAYVLGSCAVNLQPLNQVHKKSTCRSSSVCIKLHFQFSTSHQRSPISFNKKVRKVVKHNIYTTDRNIQVILLTGYCTSYTILTCFMPHLKIINSLKNNISILQ